MEVIRNKEKPHSFQDGWRDLKEQTGKSIFEGLCSLPVLLLQKVHGSFFDVDPEESSYRNLLERERKVSRCIETAVTTDISGRKATSR